VPGERHKRLPWLSDPVPVSLLNHLDWANIVKLPELLRQRPVMAHFGAASKRPEAVANAMS
jgi:hypothetical protein